MRRIEKLETEFSDSRIREVTLGLPALVADEQARRAVIAEEIAKAEARLRELIADDTVGAA